MESVPDSKAHQYALSGICVEEEEHTIGDGSRRCEPLHKSIVKPPNMTNNIVELQPSSLANHKIFLPNVGSHNC